MPEHYLTMPLRDTLDADTFVDLTLEFHRATRPSQQTYTIYSLTGRPPRFTSRDGFLEAMREMCGGQAMALASLNPLGLECSLSILHPEDFDSLPGPERFTIEAFVKQTPDA